MIKNKAITFTLLSAMTLSTLFISGCLPVAGAVGIVGLATGAVDVNFKSSSASTLSSEADTSDSKANAADEAAPVAAAVAANPQVAKYLKAYKASLNNNERKEVANLLKRYYPTYTVKVNQPIPEFNKFKSKVNVDKNAIKNKPALKTKFNDLTRLYNLLNKVKF